ncbi:Phosphonoacetaldehyde hydrolase (Phosphonatase) (Phosphonoacetaldehyde phosphonohydrolase) [Durusdinium trenchii]|uniref:Phosphonoacetaldehyde hydrolase (Phosphonatase) (Phosphonoacetaldehyde phosphonohydrolase) n=1 Tax=Durusdinium trenchii TaxID=1381693 RepID=A0ABP0LFB2_9DINO
MNDETAPVASETHGAGGPHRRLDTRHHAGASPRDAAEVGEPANVELRRIRICLTVLVILAVISTLYFARAILQPMAMAVVLSLVLKPVRRHLTRWGLPGLAAAVVVFLGFTLILVVGTRLLWQPTNHWLEQAPESLHAVREQLEGMGGPLASIAAAEKELDKLTAMTESPDTLNRPMSVRVEQPALTSQLVNSTGSLATSVGITLSLLFFLLAAGDQFLEKAVQLKKSWTEKWDTVLLAKQIEHKMSTYLGTITLINIGLGAAIAFGLWVIGMPHPLLWGALAALLNYIPFAGLVIGVCVVFVVAASEFDSLPHALLAPAIYLAANGLEANLVTPSVLRHSISLNPVVILVAVFLGGWCWGIGGIFLAVPFLLILKIFCDSHERLEPASPAVFSAYCIAAAFGTYFCMYAFRQPFKAATFDGADWHGVDYKLVLVIAQLVGYTISKFIGIKVVSEMPPRYRAISVLGLIGIAELALLLFAVTPPGWNVVWLFVNGLPLGMVFGLVLGFLEGRQVTEALTAGLCASFIFGSGFVKTVGRRLIEIHGVSEFWMPFLTGLIFVVPLLLSVWLLSLIPPPTAEDERLRTKRSTMNRQARHGFFRRHVTGLVGIITIYILLTIVRSIREDFAVEIWQELGEGGEPDVYAWSELMVMIGVVIVTGFTIWIRNNRAAFLGSLAIACAGFLIVCASVLGQQANVFSPMAFMVLLGTGMYIPYVIIHTTVFERMIATFRETATIGYLMYLADAIGYLGYVAVMIYRNLSSGEVPYLPLLLWMSAVVAIVSIVIAGLLIVHYYRSTSEIATEERTATGLRVVLVERNAAPQGATVRNFGQVVPSGMDHHWQMLGRESLNIYKSIHEQFPLPLWQDGSIYLASDQEEMTLIEELHKRNLEVDYPSELWTVQQCIARYPQLRSDYCRGGLFFPEELSVTPRLLIKRMHDYLREQPGFQSCFRTCIKELQPCPSGVTAVTTAGHTVRAEKVMLCCGSELQLLYPNVLLESDIRLVKLQMLRLEPQPEVSLPGNVLTGLTIRRYESFSECPSWTEIKSREAEDSFEKRFGIHLLYKQEADGGIIIGDSHEYANASESTELSFELRGDINDYFLTEGRKIFDLPNWNVEAAWYGVYCQTDHPSGIFTSEVEPNIHIATAIGESIVIELVVFDMAGTTVDEDNVVYKTVRAAINAAGYEFTQEQVQTHGAGKEKSQAIRDVLAVDGDEHSEEEVQQIFADFKQRLATAYRELDVREQPGAADVFAALRERGIKSVLNTGYDRATAESLIAKLGWQVGKQIDALVTASDVPNNRPHPDMIYKAMELTGVGAADAVAKVGDSQIDIEEGKNAGCGMTFGITTGAQSEDQLQESKPTAVLHSLAELVEAVAAEKCS